MNRFRIALTVLILLSVACASLPQAAPTALPTTEALAPLPTLTAQPPVESTPLPPEPIPPTATAAAPALGELVPIQPSNLPGEWLLIDSPNALRTLHFDGVFVWAGSEAGGLVQWEPTMRSPLRHTRATGFPLTSVYDLASDASTGYVYAVGDTGFAMWDGSAWQYWYAEQLGFPADLPLSAVAVEPGTSVLWIGGQEGLDYADYFNEPTRRGGGLLRWDWQTGEMQRFSAPDPLLSNQINDLLVGLDGTLWVASGLYGSEPTDGGISFRSPDGNWGEFGRQHGSDGFAIDRGLNGYGFGSLAQAADGRIYAASRRGVSWLEPGAEKWQFVEFWDAQQMALDDQGYLWVAAREGLFRLENDYPVNVFTRGTQSVNYRAAAFDGQGGIWFGGEQGLSVWQEGTLQELSVPGALPSMLVTDLALNGDGSLWLRSGGVVCQILEDAYIQCYPDETTAIEAASPWTGTTALWPLSPEGKLWLLEERTAWAYDGSSWASVALDAGSGEYIQGFAVGPGDRLALSSEAGLELYDPAGQARSVTWVASTDFYTVVQHPFFDAAGSAIWGSSAYSNFFPGPALRYSLDSQTWETIADPLLANLSPQGLSLSPSGEIWAATADGHLLVLRQDTWQVLPITAEAMGSVGFAWVKFGLGADLWLATIDPCGFEAVCVSGLVYYDSANWMRFTPENSPLASAWIFDVVHTPGDMAWVATTAGLQKFSPP